MPGKAQKTRKPRPKLAAVILAAGKGTRMRSRLPKVMHRIAGKPLLAHVLAGLGPLKPSRTVIVVAPGMGSVEQAALAENGNSEFAVQARQLGTGHAVLSSKEALGEFEGTLLILFGDTPLVTSQTLQRMRSMLESSPKIAAVALAARFSDPAGYGRLVVDPKGNLRRVVESRDASGDEQRIDLCNAGAVAVRAPLIFELLAGIKSENNSNEYYLTDIFAAANARGMRCRVVEAFAQEVMGINTRAELAEAERILQQRLRARAMAAGVTMLNPLTVTLAADTVLGQDVILHPHVVFGPGVRVGRGVEIRSFCHLEGATVGADAVIGPFARLRPGAELAQDAHVGNFVEIKKSRLGRGAKANHLSYIGDSEVGPGANIGAGTITCNYDGFKKHRTVIGAGAFIGSNSSLVAPVKIGKGALVGAGSVITRDVPPDALAIARGPQTVEKGGAKKWRAKRKDVRRNTE